MKPKINFIATLVLFFLVSCSNPENAMENTTVLVRYKTQPNKNVDAFESLKRLIEEIKKEDHFVMIKMMVDPNDNSNILLYEVWEDEQYYRGEHMQKEHLQEFINQSQQFLAGPPEISYYKVEEVYK